MEIRPLPAARLGSEKKMLSKVQKTAASTPLPHQVLVSRFTFLKRLSILRVLFSSYTSSRPAAATRPYQRPESLMVRFWVAKST